MKRAAVVIIVILLAAYALLRERAPEPSTPSSKTHDAATRERPRFTWQTPRVQPQRQVLSDGMALEGLLLDANDAPVGEGTINVSSPAIQQTTLSDAHGTFAIAGLAPGSYKIWASHGDLIASPRTITLASNTLPVILRLERCYPLDLTIVDEQKAGVQEADVVVQLEDHEQIKRTDAQGVVSFCTGERAIVRAHKAGFAWTKDAYAVGASGVRETLTLMRALRITGKVVDEHGRAIARAHINADPAPDVDTNEQGEFTIEDVLVGEYSLMVRHDDYTATSVTTEAGKDIVVRLERGRTVSGTVVDTANAPVARARVTLAWHDPAQQADRKVVYSDAQGRFSLTHIPPGKITAFAATDRAMSTPQLIEDDAVTLRLDRAGAMSGRVVSPTGAPVPGAVVFAWPKDRVFDMDMVDAYQPQMDVADADGHFTLRALPAVPHMVRAHLNGAAMGAHVLTQQALTEAQPGETNVRVVLLGNGTLKGHTTCDAYELSLMPATAKVRKQSVKLRTRDFVLHDIPAGSYDLAVDGCVQKTLEDVTIKDGAETDVGAL